MAATLTEVIEWVVRHRPGLSDAELAEALHGRRDQALVSGECRELESRGTLERRKEGRDVIRNYPKGVNLN